MYVWNRTFKDLTKFLMTKYGYKMKRNWSLVDGESALNSWPSGICKMIFTDRLMAVILIADIIY